MLFTPWSSNTLGMSKRPSLLKSAEFVGPPGRRRYPGGELAPTMTSPTTPAAQPTPARIRNASRSGRYSSALTWLTRKASAISWQARWSSASTSGERAAVSPKLSSRW